MKKNWNTIVLFSVDILFYIHKYTWPTQSKIIDIQKYMWVYFNVLSRRMHPFSRWKSYHENTMSFWRNYVDLQTFLKTKYTEEVHHRNLRKAEKGDVRRRRATQISYSSLFSIRIDAFRHVLTIEINRMLQEYFKNTCIYLAL